MKIRANAVTINERDDGRVEVAIDGYVQWCGRDRAAAHAVAKSHSGPTLHRDFDDRMLSEAIGRLR